MGGFCLSVELHQEGSAGLFLPNFTLSSSRRRETEQNIIVVAVFRGALNGQAGPGPGQWPLSSNKTCFTAGIWQEKGRKQGIVV